MSEHPTPDSPSPTNLEFSLDNRQVVFLFFGLAVVGCFVFGLGVMAGRRLDGADAVAASAPSEKADGDPALAAALAPTAGEVAAAQPVNPVEQPAPASDLAFRQGLSQPLPTAIPATRPANVPPKSERAANAPADRPASAKPEGVKAVLTKSAPAIPGVASSKATAKAATPEKPGTIAGKFTLVVKSFAEQADAQALAGSLRTKGYASKVESVTEKGKVAFRVRIGTYASWDEGITAKTAFEKAEKRVAWLTAAQAR